jgi:hypothetical protein
MFLTKVVDFYSENVEFRNLFFNSSFSLLYYYVEYEVISSLLAKEWIPRAPAIVKSSLSGMDTKMSEVQTHTDGQYSSAAPNRPVGELNRLPHTTSLRLGDFSVFYRVAELVVCEGYTSCGLMI